MMDTLGEVRVIREKQRSQTSSRETLVRTTTLEASSPRITCAALWRITSFAKVPTECDLVHL